MDKEKYIAMEKNQLIMTEALLDAVAGALDGKEPSDFELSFPIVRKAWDMYLNHKAALTRTLERMRGVKSVHADSQEATDIANICMGIVKEVMVER